MSYAAGSVGIFVFNHDGGKHTMYTAHISVLINVYYHKAEVGMFR